MPDNKHAFIDSLISAFPKLKYLLKYQKNEHGKIDFRNNSGNVQIIQLPINYSKEQIVEAAKIFSPLFKQHHPEHLVRIEDTSAKEEFVRETAKEIAPTLILFIDQNIPQQDRSLWKIALRLKLKKINSNPDVVKRIKDDLRQMGGQKGVNIANLASSSYLEEEIIPTFKSLPNEDRGDVFSEYYQKLVTKLYKSVFVSSHKQDINQLVEEICNKVKDARTYQLDDVRVHALGSTNIALLDEAKAILRQEHKMRIDNDESPNHAMNLRIVIA